MTDSNKSTPDAGKPIADPKAEATNTAPLSDADLDKVAGGLNPQPLPPIVRDEH